jgi:hypothetical protein
MALGIPGRDGLRVFFWPDADPESIMSIHGTLHWISGPVSTYVLPLVHMSGQVWWRFPPDEYISRLSEALELLERQ